MSHVQTPRSLRRMGTGSSACIFVLMLAACGPQPQTQTSPPVLNQVLHMSTPAVASAPSVFPIPQEMTPSGQRVRLTAAVVVAPAGDRFAIELLQRWVGDEFLDNLPLGEASAKLPIFVGTVEQLGKTIPDRLEKLGVPKQAEGYALSIGPDAIVAAGRDRQGTLYAVATLMQLLHRDQGQLVIEGGTVRDWPYRPIRYVHVFVPGKNQIAFFKRYVRDFLLRYKFNGMILEVGGGVRLARHPEIATGWRRTFLEFYAHGDQVQKTGESCPLGPDNRFQDTVHPGIGEGGYIEAEELKDIVAFARAHGQEVVPEIQGLTHVYHLATTHREIAEIPEALFPDAYCPSNEASYKLLFEVMDEYVELMQSKTVHIGHDEWRAGGICPVCRQKHTGDLFAQDVIRIYQHLTDKGIKVWMWGDHFISGHNETGRSGRKGGPVWYDYPTTKGAWEKVKKACPDLVLLSWSWSMKGEGDKEQGRYDQELQDKGFRFLYGNFNGAGFQNWAQRTQKYDVLGAEVSSWSAMEEFQIGKMHVPMALGSINLLWSTHYPSPQQAASEVMRQVDQAKLRLKPGFQADIMLSTPKQTTVDLGKLFNVPLKGEGYDLSGLRRGSFNANGLSVKLGEGAILLNRPHQAQGKQPTQVTIPLKGQYAQLVFVQSSLGKARHSYHAGDGTFFPMESSELLGIYDVVFHDGLVLPVDIRAEENVGQWDAGIKGILYHARNIEAGTLPDGSPLVVWGREWVNPRPDEPIEEIRFRGGAGPSEARPMLLGITAIARPQLSDYRK